MRNGKQSAFSIKVNNLKTNGIKIYLRTNNQLGLFGHKLYCQIKKVFRRFVLGVNKHRVECVPTSLETTRGVKPRGHDKEQMLASLQIAIEVIMRRKAHDK